MRQKDSPGWQFSASVSLRSFAAKAQLCEVDPCLLLHAQDHCTSKSVHFQGCNKVLQPGDLNNRNLEARSLKSRCQQGHAPSETLGRILLHVFWLLASAGNHWHTLGWRCIVSISASVITEVLLVSLSSPDVFLFL